MTTLTAHAAQLTSLLKKDQEPHSIGAEVAINLAFISLTTISHCLGVKVSVLIHNCSGVEADMTEALWQN